MKPVLLVISFLALSLTACRKEAEVAQNTPPAATIAPWQKVDKAWNKDYDIEHSFVKDNILYLVADGMLMAIDSNSNLVSATPLLYNLHPAFYYRPTHNDKYVAQVNLDKHAIFIYEFLNPQVSRRIPIDNLYTIDAFGQLNNQNELLIGLKTNKAVRLTFTTQSGSIEFTADTIASGTSLSRVYASAENHFITPLNEWSVRYNSTAGFLPVGDYRISELTTISDTIYASLFWTSSSGDGLIFSPDHGTTWTQLISGIRLDYYYLHPINSDIILTYYKNIYRLRFDFQAGTYTWHPMDNKGILENLPATEEINSVVKLGNKIFASTTKGVYVKDFAEFK